MAGQGVDIPLLPFPARRILPAVQILISSMAVQNPPALLPPRSVCPLPICPSCRCRSQPLPGASRKQRYNTLDFPTENRVPTGVLLAPIGNPEPKGLPLWIPLVFIACVYTSLPRLVYAAISENKKIPQSSSPLQDELCGIFCYAEHEGDQSKRVPELPPTVSLYFTVTSFSEVSCSASYALMPSIISCFAFSISSWF